jgi:hypothetical protein
VVSASKSGATAPIWRVMVGLNMFAVAGNYCAARIANATSMRNGWQKGQYPSPFTIIDRILCCIAVRCRNDSASGYFSH